MHSSAKELSVSCGSGILIIGRMVRPKLWRLLAAGQSQSWHDHWTIGQGTICQDAMKLVKEGDVMSRRSFHVWPVERDSLDCPRKIVIKEMKVAAILVPMNLNVRVFGRIFFTECRLLYSRLQSESGSWWFPLPLSSWESQMLGYLSTRLRKSLELA